MNMIDGIASSCCVYNRENSKIVLYYVGNIEVKDLMVLLKEKLPRYMLPNKLDKLEVMPLTPNGKLDRNRLLMKTKEEE